MSPIETISVGQRGGFNLRFEFYPEDTHPADHFDDTVCDLREILYKIETGQWVWFWVKCVASVNDIDLGSDSLGGCLYESFEEFVSLDGDYAESMIEQTLKEARSNVKQITEKI